MIGQILNYRYEVLEKVGDGDFFSTYKSRDKVLNRLVALKVLNGELAEHTEFARSVQEGYKFASVLDHPNIARTQDADPASGERFVTCEFVRGINVKERIRRAGPIAVPLALDIIINVLEALEYAHANRIVHGDIRPQDIIVSPDGEVKVTDFGLSYAIQKHPAVADRYAMHAVHYEAPEIAEGAAPSVASDIYSVGAIFYEMVTGSVPFDGATAVAVALKKSKEIPDPPRTLNTGVPKSLSDVIMRAIERSPSDRYPNASVMLADLRAIRDGIRTGRPIIMHQTTVVSKPRVEHDESEGELTPTDGSLKKSLLWLMVLFVAVVCVSTLAVSFYLRSDHSGVRVPALLGKTWEEASNIAKDAGLTLQDDGQVYSDTYAAGQICSVIPPAGAVVQSDIPIKVKISKGPSRVPIPDFTGLPEAEAYRLASEKGFTITKVTGEHNDRVPVNSVVSQNPEAGIARAPGSAISLVVSLGPGPGSGSGSDDSSDNRPTSEERKFDILVEVPNDVDGLQEVRIVVEDDRGETTAYQRYHEPGDRFTETVDGYGSSVRIKVYVGDQLASDAKY